MLSKVLPVLTLKHLLSWMKHQDINETLVKVKCGYLKYNLW
jgi:hypothetical protein